MLSILCPCYNEEKSVNLLYSRVISVMENSNEKFQIIFVDDGSRDNTLNILKNIASNDERVKVIEFSRNFGIEPALTALLDYSEGDAVVIIDADLQHPPEISPSMIEKWREGFDIVYTKRTNRNSDGAVRKFLTSYFYKIYNIVSEAHIIEEVGEFCLMDRRVVNAVLKFKETHKFMRGIFSWIGFRRTMIDYVCEQRYGGESKFTFRKLFALAFDGLLSFSSFPLKLIFYLGVLSLFGVFFYGITNSFVSEMFFVLLLFSLNFLCTGIIGMYIGRAYDETKNRPLYIVREIYSKNDEKTDS
ncbi:MAG: glycosyltransferase family 2 protein [Synergistaceae bacterium]|nr:glycosyltransferase family 2 protein [Synergistaceae bacterium]